MGRDEVAEKSYVLGTHDEELTRLGLQHQVWRAEALGAWLRAGARLGQRVVDVGAGPGYATCDLAELVGADGQVIAVERSARYLEALRTRAAARGLTWIEAHEIDLEHDAIPARNCDLAWCRWVAAFVRDPGGLARKIAAALRSGGRVVWHEYAGYESWRLRPRGAATERFVAEVIANWRAWGGEPNAALGLIEALPAAGLRLLEARPAVFAARPNELMWQWPAAFVRSHLPRLVESGRVTAAWAGEVAEEWNAAERDATSLTITPLVLEMIAEKQ